MRESIFDTGASRGGDPDLVRHRGELSEMCASGSSADARALCRCGGVRAEGRPVSAAAGQGRARRHPVRPRRRRRAEGFVSARAAAAATARRRLPLRQRSARCAAGGARLRARRLPLHALPQGRSTQDQARSAAKPRSRGAGAHRRGGDAGARPHQHAGERHGAGRARGGGARARRAARRRHQRRRRRRSADEEFPARFMRSAAPPTARRG